MIAATLFRIGMLKRIALILCIFFSPTSEAAMVPSNVLTRVFSLRLGQNTATGFTIEVDKRQYLITARHVIAAEPSASEIEIFHNNTWVKVSFRLIAVEPPSVDIAVLALNQQISQLLPIQLGVKSDYFLSQEVFFVGFPYNLTVNGHQLNRGFPLPFVKHGIIAATAGGEGEPFMVDGINNPGFSGGPIVIGGDRPIVIGVGSGYQAVTEPVYRQRQAVPDLSVQSNTGLLVGYDLEYAVRAIETNPIGYLVDQP